MRSAFGGKDGQLVVELQHGKISYGPGYEGRVVIRAKQYENGHVPLTIFKVQWLDGGMYCSKYRHDEAGQPEAISLHISGECF